MLDFEGRVPTTPAESQTGYLAVLQLELAGSPEILGDQEAGLLILTILCGCPVQ